MTNIVRRRLSAPQVIVQQQRQRIMRVLMQGAQVVADDAADRIYTGAKTGRLYRSKWRKGFMHQASAPGQSPAADSGRLAQSMSTRPLPSRLAADVVNNAPYARALEYGTSKMAPRPFMSPAFRAHYRAIGAAIRTAMRGGR